MFRLTPVVKILLIINVALLLLNMFSNGLINDQLALYTYGTQKFAVYQVFSYMFLHANWWHLFSNMFGLVIFGPMLEERWGVDRFLAFYIAVGIGAGILYGAFNYYEYQQLQALIQEYKANPDISERTISYMENSANVGMVGASGALFGILAAFALLFPNLRLMLLFPPIPIKAKYLVLGYMIFEIYSGLQRTPGDNVAHFAHIAGGLVAFVIVKLIWKEKRVY